MDAIKTSIWEHIKEAFSTLGNIPENAWGFGIIAIAAMLALVAHGTGDKDLFGLASGTGMTGAAIMHAKKE